MKKRRFFRRAFAIAVLTTLASANAFGLSTKYYQTSLSVSPTGAGTVYASVNYTKPADSEFGTTSTTGAVLDSVSYAFAKPATGKGFLNWTQGGAIYSTDNPVMIVNQSTTGTQSNPATISLVANFVDAAVSAISDNEVFGTVRIDNVANELGDAVELTATPSTNTFKASEFEGWYLNGTKVSGDNPYIISEITASNSGIYTAKFTRKAGYFRIKSQYTGKYAYVFGNSARQSNSSTDGFSGVIFDGSIALKAANQLDFSDPGYIVKIDGITEGYYGGLKDLDVTCQGIGFKQIVNQQYPNADIDANPSGNYWTFSYDYSGARYFKDGTNYGYNYAIACGGASDHLWTLEPINSTNYFGVDASIESEGLYYTTMYTKFPYQCSQGITPYILTSDYDLEAISNRIVPANTPVILKCQSSQASNNILTPLFDDYSAISGNILQGYCSVNDTLIGDGNIQILGYDEDEGLTFVTLPIGSTITKNCAYITNSNNAREAKASFNESTGVRNIQNNNVQEDHVYDLMGRKIHTSDKKSLAPGVYIVNGKKVSIK